VGAGAGSPTVVSYCSRSVSTTTRLFPFLAQQRRSIGTSSTPDEVANLKRTIVELQSQIAARDATIAQLVEQLRGFQNVAPGSTTPSANGAGGAAPTGYTEISDGKTLKEAILAGVCHVMVKPGTVIDFEDRFEMKQGQLHLLGHGARIRGNWKIRDGVHFSARGIAFEALSKDRAVIEVIGAKATISFISCEFSHGRDGLYLSGGASCTATDCKFIENVRGVFESFRCSFKGSNCRFQDNIFHMVLLSKPRHKDRVDEVAAAQHTFEGHQSRGDLALSYNPVTDTYEDVFKDGLVVVLTPHESTTNLAEPSW
jgi:hypothetical protein